MTKSGEIYEKVELFLFKKELSQSFWDGRNGSNACTFICLIKGFLFSKLNVEIPVGPWSDLASELDTIINIICCAIQQGNKAYDFFKDGLPHHEASVDEAATLLQPYMYCRPILETAVFLRREDDGYTLAFQLERLASFKRKCYAVYVCNKKTSIFVFDGNSVCYIDTHCHTYERKNGGTLLVTCGTPKRLFIEEISRANNISSDDYGNLVIVRF